MESIVLPMKSLASLIILGLISFSALAERRVYFSSEITQRSIDRLESSIVKQSQKLKENEERIVVVDLDSGGGNIQEAIRFVRDVYRLSLENRIEINTRIRNGSCESACTIMFTAGEKRIASKYARFGFHTPKLESRVPAGRTKNEILEWARSLWLDAISRVDTEASYRIREKELLYSSEMIYLSGKELNTGYVNTLQ